MGNIIGERIIQLFIAPPKICLQAFQPYQYLDRNVGPRREIGNQHPKGSFIQPAERLPVEHPRPRTFQAFTVFFGQIVDVTDQNRL